MSKAAKILQAMLGGQYKSWAYRDLEKALVEAGFVEVSREGSHCTWKHPRLPKLHTIPVPSSGDVNWKYVRNAMSAYRTVLPVPMPEPLSGETEETHG